jgi:hypothetical protein
MLPSRDGERGFGFWWLLRTRDGGVWIGRGPVLRERVVVWFECELGDGWEVEGRGEETMGSGRLAWGMNIGVEITGEVVRVVNFVERGAKMGFWRYDIMSGVWIMELKGVGLLVEETWEIPPFQFLRERKTRLKRLYLIICVDMAFIASWMSLEITFVV